MNVAVMLLLLTTHAPAPKDRPPPPAPAVAPGVATMTWHGTDAYTVFHADGFYACLWAGSWWHGHYECKGGSLYVTEWPMDQPGRRSTWTVKLKCPKTGAFAGGTAWKVTPLVGRVY